MSEPWPRRASQVLDQCQRLNLTLGHENLGSLSVERGFVPVIAPLPSFPETHRPWDTVAADLPDLHRTMRLRAVLERMPVLDADASSLPEQALTRAATVLGIFGHAYHHVSCRAPGRLPPAVAAPWAQVRQRLGRPDGEVLSYLDLVVNNWRLLDDRAPDLWCLDNLRLLVPTVDNQEEHVFSLTQLQILARSAPVLPAVARAQDAVLDDDPSALGPALLRVEGAVRDITWRSLPGIDPRKGSATYVDPVVWAKTVAPLAVPIHPGLSGPSGVASPLVHLMDVFLGRSRHDTRLGREALRLRAGFPPHWRRLLAAVERVSVPAYVAAVGDDELSDRLDAVRLAYSGTDGFLGRHRRKVFGFVHIAFEVGKRATSGGFAGGLSDQVDCQVDDALDQSRAERVSALVPARPAPGAPRRAHRAAMTSAAASVRVSELTEHNTPERGEWTAVCGGVYDVSRLLDRHPGGQQILRAYAGVDATQAFTRVHPDSPGVERLRRATQTGRLQHPVLPDSPLPGGGTPVPELYRRWVQALYLVVELQNALRLDRGLHRNTALDGSAGPPPTPYLLDRALDTCERFAHTYLPSVVDDVLAPLVRQTRTGSGPPDPTNRPRSWDEGSPAPTADAGSSQAGAGVLLQAPPRASARDLQALPQRVDFAAARLQSLDTTLDVLVTSVRQVVVCFERDPDPRALGVALDSATTSLWTTVCSPGSTIPRQRSW